MFVCANVCLTNVRVSLLPESLRLPDHKRGLGQAQRQSIWYDLLLCLALEFAFADRQR